MISRELKTIFVHIPKTGGMSIEKMLGADVKRIHKSSMTYKHGFPWEALYPRYWDDYFKFTFVRNPWDRVVSGYFFDLQMATNKGEDACSRRRRILELGEEGFDTFVLEELADVIQGDSSNRWYLPQITWIKGYSYDFIGRFENFAMDMERIRNSLDLSCSLEHTNKSEHKYYKEYYNGKTRSRVHELYREDIDKLGYEW